MCICGMYVWDVFVGVWDVSVDVCRCMGCIYGCVCVDVGVGVAISDTWGCIWCLGRE